MMAAVGRVVAGVVLLTACTSRASRDFGRSAERFIESDRVEKPARTTFTHASCGEPEDHRPGSTFTCTAVAADGSTWAFDLVVKDAHNFQLKRGNPKA